MYKYTYRITMSEQNDAESFVKVYIKGTPRTKIMREKDCASAFVENAYRCLGYVVKNGGREITYYSIGGESEISCLSCDGGGAEFAAELVDKSCETFKAFAEAFRPDGVFSEEDWYWIAVDFFNDTVYKGALLPPLSYVQDCSFVRWYFYELAVPAGAIKENTVSAPLYPASSQDANRFRCQISSLSSFPFFGGITVEVNTPLNMSYSSLEFTKEENVFSFRREELPFGELSFVLSETKGEGVFGAEGRRLDPMLLSIILLSVAVAGAIVATTVLYVKNKRARAISARKQTRAQMGRPEEGKIEDGSFQNRKE